ncbi:MAG: hypothetical protein WD595_06195 [Waddliaceae bacterium]
MFGQNQIFGLEEQLFARWEQLQDEIISSIEEMELKDVEEKAESNLHLKVEHNPEHRKLLKQFLKAHKSAIYFSLEKLQFDFMTDHIPLQITDCDLIKVTHLFVDWKEVMEGFEHHPVIFNRILDRFNLLNTVRESGMTLNVTDLYLLNLDDFDTAMNRIELFNKKFNIKNFSLKEILNFPEKEVEKLSSLSRLCPQLTAKLIDEKGEDPIQFFKTLENILDKAAAAVRLNAPYPDDLPFSLSLGIEKVGLSAKDNIHILPADILLFIDIGENDYDSDDCEFLFLLETGRGDPVKYLETLGERKWNEQLFEMTGWASLLSHPPHTPQQEEIESDISVTIKRFESQVLKLPEKQLSHLLSGIKDKNPLNTLLNNLTYLSEKNTHNLIPLKPLLNTYLKQVTNTLTNGTNERVNEAIFTFHQVIESSCYDGTYNRLSQILSETLYCGPLSIIGNALSELKSNILLQVLDEILRHPEIHIVKLDELLESYDDNRPLEFMIDSLKQQSVHFQPAIALQFGGTLGFFQSNEEQDYNAQVQYGDFIKIFYDEILDHFDFIITSEETMSVLVDLIMKQMEVVLNERIENYDALKTQLDKLIEKYFPEKEFSDFLEEDDDNHYTLSREIGFAILMDYGIIRPKTEGDDEGKEE